MCALQSHLLCGVSRLFVITHVWAQVSDSQCDARQEASLSELQMCVYQEDEAADTVLTDS